MKKKKPNSFLRTLFILFLLYIGLFITGTSNYYEYKTKEEVILTEENIKKFEEDIKNNKEIDIENYKVKNNKDYSNFASNMGENFSNFIEKLLTKELSKTSKELKKWFSP